MINVLFFILECYIIKHLQTLSRYEKGLVDFISFLITRSCFTCDCTDCLFSSFSSFLFLGGENHSNDTVWFSVLDNRDIPRPFYEAGITVDK